MRKRRRLANKMTIMVCAVLIAVSAFFYAPMDVSAEESFSYTVSGSGSAPYNQRNYEVYLPYDLDLVEGLENDSLYEVHLNYSGVLNISSPLFVRYLGFFYGDNIIHYSQNPGNEWNSTSFDLTFDEVVFLKGSDLIDNDFIFQCMIITGGDSNVTSISYSLSNNLKVVSCEKLSNEDSEDYQNGYNAGYSAGEQAGYGNGYSQGFSDGEASVDTDAIYDEAFQAGKDSVDTQSYYDAGYQAGYQFAYSDGYDSGYDVGYQDAMDRIASWGADTSDYPKQLYSIDMGHTFSTNVTYSVPFLYRDSVKGYLSNLQLNPNHTYRFDVEIYPHDWDSADTITYENEFYFCIGGIDYPLTYFSTDSCLTSLFVPGDRMSDSYYLVWSTIRASVDGTNNICRVVCPYTITLYDMGPSGDTQNHIANQTDQLTNGYDDSKGNTVNSELSTGLNEFETAENSLFATAATGMKDFTFFDFESVPAMVTGMSFIGSIMGSWFNQAGGASGVGIVLAILFSVILVAMVLGLYRWYQSRGGKN